MIITFITGNQNKWSVAAKVLSAYGIDLISKKIETPEIQSTDVKEISKFSAEYALKEIGEPVLKTDVGYYIEALNGFPGPFVKFVNNWLSAQDILSLLKSKQNRKIEIIECLTYCHPDGTSAQFISRDSGTIASDAYGEGSSFDQIVVRDKLGKPQSAYSSSEMLEYWSQNLSHFHEFGQYLSSK